MCNRLDWTDLYKTQTWQNQIVKIFCHCLLYHIGSFITLVSVLVCWCLSVLSLCHHHWLCTSACAQVLSVCIQVTWVNLLNAGISKYLHIVNVWTMYEYFQRKTRERTNIHQIQCWEKGLSPSWFIRFCTFYTLKCQIINKIVIIDKDNLSM